MDRPLVSVIIPTHRPHYFVRALRSVLAQEYENLEIIVSDNSGGDEIRAVCDAHPGVRYIRNESGKPHDNICNGLAVCQGEWVKYLFDDDLLYPNCIATMVAHVNRNGPSARFVFSSRQIINEHGETTGMLAPFFDSKLEKEVAVLDGRNLVKLMISRIDNFIGEFSTVLFHRDLIGGPKPDAFFSVFGMPIKGLVDVAAFARMLQATNALYIRHPLSAFRIHSAMGTKIDPNIHLSVSDWWLLIQWAHAAGVLNDGELLASARVYLTHAARFPACLPNTGPSIAAAQALINANAQAEKP